MVERSNGFEAAVSGYRKKAITVTWITVCVLGVLFLALAVSLFVDLLGRTIEYTLELGDELPSAYTLSGGHGDAEYDFGSEDGVFDTPGEYVIYMEYGGRRVKIKLTVEDTTPPKATLLSLNVHRGGPIPAAIDFFKDVKDASEYTAKFKNTVDLSELGSYEVRLELFDTYGNKRNYETVVNVIIDTEPPTINAPISITGYVGEGVAYLKDVEAVDNCYGVTLTVDSSAVDTSRAGTYKVKYTATDAAGLVTTLTLNVNIFEDRVTEEDLLAKVEALASELGITKSMSKEEQVKRIYGYVNSPRASASSANIVFTNESNTDRSDWMREAYLTIERGEGDCYSYFAVSKAFFLYFGIDNLDIERSKGVTTQSGTHFWSMVNIGTENNPRWYYYDATRLAKSHPNGSGCLFTEAQLEEYNNKVNPGFLTFDHTDYPAAATTVINKNYSW